MDCDDPFPPPPSTLYSLEWRKHHLTWMLLAANNYSLSCHPHNIRHVDNYFVVYGGDRSIYQMIWNELVGLRGDVGGRRHRGVRSSGYNMNKGKFVEVLRADHRLR